MATLIRTVRILVIAAAALALIAPVAQAKPLEVPSGPIHASVTATGTATQATSGSSFGWTDAAIGAAITAVLIGVGVSGARLSHRRTAHA
jgi:hypothetical protein